MGRDPMVQIHSSSSSSSSSSGLTPRSCPSRSNNYFPSRGSTREKLSEPLSECGEREEEGKEEEEEEESKRVFVSL